MAQPTNCENFYYKLMKKCWKFDPGKRPKFHEIIIDLLSNLTNGNEEFVTNFQKNSYFYKKNSETSHISFNYVLNFKFRP